MRLRIHLIFPLVFCLPCINCTSSKVTDGNAQYLPAAALHPFGRWAVDSAQNVELISSAVHFGFRFQGKSCQVLASLPSSGTHNYLQYELDGQYQKKIKISGDSTQAFTLSAASDGPHTVWIYKATEAHTGPILINGIRGYKVTALQRPAAPLIEFIGNSITCGAAADASEQPCGTGEYHDQHNAYYAYGPRVARTLGTNFLLSSVSGIGIYRNWNSNGPTMPQVYEKLDFQDNHTREWDFTRYHPQVISIALGTNDFSAGDGIKKRLPFDSTSFVSQYIRFVQSLKTKHPEAQIALLSSPMISGANRTKLQNCLAAVKENIDALFPGEKRVALYFFNPMKPNGCTGHPSVEDHTILARELEPFFRKLLLLN